MNSAATSGKRREVRVRSICVRSGRRIILATAALVTLLFSSIVAQEAIDPPPPPIELPKIELETAPFSDLWREINEEDTEPRRAQREVRLHTGPPDGNKTEKAVLSALQWLGEHQLADGSWSFDHHRCADCEGKCGNPGSLADARNAGTGLALLAILGSGQTHEVGKFKNEVKAGLDYLIEHMKDQTQGGSLHERGGTMYSHGIATIAICEAYALSADKELMTPAQKAVDFICYAQDPVGGGWRYMPRQSGDTSVTGWQLSALKSAHLAYLRVPPATVKRASSFLDSVQAEDGAGFGYTQPGDKPATTAIGLLMRMYLDGKKKKDPALKPGVSRIAKLGPSKDNMYYNYYATQVLHHWDGRKRQKWNTEMRDYLVESQASEGPEAGSWFFPGRDHGSRGGGRLYCTAMATVILEVYYRHLPHHRKQAIELSLPRD